MICIDYAIFYHKNVALAFVNDITQLKIYFNTNYLIKSDKTLS